MEPTAPRTAYALLGDIVHSRAARDRVVLHHAVVDALAWCDEVVPPLEPLAVTVGDEFQGTYATIGDAVLASLLVRLALLPLIDVRCGLARGEVQVIDGTRRPPLQDGSAWWGAREAVEEAERRAAAPATRGCRTWYVDGDAADPAEEAAVRAVLVLRDEIVSRLEERPLRVLRGVMSDRTQMMVAEQEGITQSAVSQLISRGGLAAVKEAHALLRPAADDDPR